MNKHYNPLRLRPAFRWLALLPALWLATVSAAPDPRTPEELVDQTARELAERVERDRAQLAADQDALFALVDEVLLPVFDTQYAGRQVLGRHGRKATPEQRKNFIDAFYYFLLRSYAENVLKFRKDQVRVLPPRSAEYRNQQRTAVRTQMKLDDDTTLAVDYSLRNTAEGWRIFDVRIEGVSYVQTYRSQFDAEISAKGLDAVIERLKTAEPEKNPGTTPAATTEPATGE
jgi:phospholipid transport system substrate-binding protein